MIAAQLGRLAIALLVACAFALGVWRANELNVFENAPIVVLDAVPAALTHIFVPSMPRYTVAEDISQAFYVSPKSPPRAADQVNASILRISEMDHRATSYNLLGFIDDRGIIDFVELAFRIFGMKIQSVAVLFYAVLFVSSLLFYGVYRRTLAALASLACILFAQYQILPEIVLNGQLASPLALRCAPILSLVAVMHCCLYCFRKTVRPVELVALLCQAFLIIFVLHMRSTALWQVLAVATVGISAALWRWRWAPASSKGSLAQPIVSLLAPALLAAGIGGLSLYRTVAFPIDYRTEDQLITRAIWHNVYSGFALHPELAAARGLRIDDESIVEDVGRYAKRHQGQENWKRIGGDTPHFTGLKWAAYDRIAYDALADVCRTQSRYCLETFLLYKPYYLFDSLLWFYGLRDVPKVMDAFISPIVGDSVKKEVVTATESIKERDLAGAPWSTGSLLLIAVLTAALSVQPRRAVWFGPAVLSMALIAAASIAPSIAGYPAPHTMSDAAVAVSAFLQFAAVAAATLLVWTIRRRWNNSVDP